MAAYRRNRRRRYRRKSRPYRVRTRVKRRYGGVKTRRRSLSRNLSRPIIYRPRATNFLADTAIATLKDVYATYWDLGDVALTPSANNNYIGQFFPLNYFQSGQIPTFDMYSARFHKFRIIRTTFVVTFQNMSAARPKDVGILIPSVGLPTWTPSAPPTEQPHCRYTTLSVISGVKDMKTLRLTITPKQYFGTMVDSSELELQTNDPTTAPEKLAVIYLWQGDGLNAADTNPFGVRARVKVYYKCLFYERAPENA